MTTSSSSTKLKALLKKNVTIMFRNCCTFVAEILFPVILMLIIYAIRQAFKVKTHLFEDEETNDDTFFEKRSTAYLTRSEYRSSKADLKWNSHISLRDFLYICSPENKNKEERPIIALINVDSYIENAINLMYQENTTSSMTFQFKKYDSIEKMEEYVSDNNYGTENNPLICFGISFESKENKNYKYALHYFDTTMDGAVQDIPDGRSKINDEFQVGPDMAAYHLFVHSGFNQIQKIIMEYILNKETNKVLTFNYGMMAMKYEKFKTDPFGAFVGYIVPFFIVIAYMCPLCLYVLRIVREKETKAKEGMKIMGMSESTYFLSYFIQFFITNIFYSLCNSIIMKLVFTHTGWEFLFITFLLWGLNVFALAFFFQSFIDKTRVALILSLLIYFVMYFFSMAVMDDGAAKGLKIVLSIFPSIALELGIIIFGYFEAHFQDFKWKNFAKTYQNYSVIWMFLMMLIDFLLYLFLGYYLQNIVSHEFGIAKPFYFLCTKSYWCPDDNTRKNKKKKAKTYVNENKKVSPRKNQNENEGEKISLRENGSKQSEIEYEHPENFQSEELYKDMTEKDDVMKVRDLVKKFDDGKVAVKGVSINFYKDEIFALLGHNGAGKSTMISMLCGMYEATEGEAFYDGMDILDGDNMDEFRQKLGICPQHDVLFDELNIREHLSMFGTFKGIDSDKLDQEVEQTMKDFQLTGMQDIIAKDLSAGQRRKLSIAIALIGGSQVIFLDEPSSGMDITSRRNLWDILKRMTENKIIILTTHYMEEASVLGNRIGIINSGEMKCVGTPLFLIERYGRFMSLNITKEPSAHNQEIIDFVDELAKDIEYEILSEQIMFRIPKVNYSKESGGDGFLEKFFEKLDQNQEKLRIKSYTAAMPTLEDVFLNVAAEDILALKGGHRKFSQVNEENDRILFEEDCREDYSQKSKFCNDFGACMTKRYYNTIRDSKGFLLEMICPILLILVGLIVSQVKFKTHSDPIEFDFSEIGENTIYYASQSGVTINNDFLKSDNELTTFKQLDISPTTNTATDIKTFYEKLYSINDEKCFGGIYVFKDSLSTNPSAGDVFNFIVFINTQATFGAMYFPHYFLTKAVKILVPDIQITFTSHSMPLTAEEESNAGQTSNSLIVFFVAVAFSLIPANFITIIVKERVNNSKHLMRISGMSFFAYWLTNYIFELAKYYITAGVCLLLIWAFDFYEKYFVIFYLIYGPPMISFTYLMSFWFSSETSAQNGAILLNFLIGALGSSVVLMFRGLESMQDFGKGLEFLFGFIPSFNLAYGYDVLLNHLMLYITNYPDDWQSKAADEKFVISINYTGLQIAYLCITFVLYLIILIILEHCSTRFGKSPNETLESTSKDPDVIKESKRATGQKFDEDDPNDEKKEYAIQIQNLRKYYKKEEEGCCNSSEVKAVRNLSFCLEYGECFGLLGVNGAGKTTTFKCITNEHSQQNGKIFIDGKDISENFSKLSQVFGYCPQFDAIFEYMTVYENLNFYAKIKGIALDKMDKIIDALIEEMSLAEFPNKIAGRLSGGNKRKLSVAISMICNPPIILLDEPSTGMDPEARRFMWAVIHKISTKRKKSSVIMTTHSMDEAETLCKRMGIMVNGEFVCLGGSQEIKDKYGYGFEADIRIKPLADEKANEICKEKGIDKKLIIKPNNINDTLTKLGKEHFISELTKGRLGEKLLREVSTNERFRVYQLIAWTYFVENAFRLIKKSKQYFDEIILTEYIDNNFLFKLKRGENSKSIGFLFGLFESEKDECHVTEYSIQPTSLEQIFNKFAAKQGHDEEAIDVEQEKTEIVVDDELINKFTK